MNKKKIIGIFLVIFGIFIIGNAIFMVFNYVSSIGFPVPITPEDWWRNWWMNYGTLTIVMAIVGVILLGEGLLYLLKKEIQITKIILIILVIISFGFILQFIILTF
ncbi:MAG: hypothetical protein EU550_02510 [Promethearchaeota archaeon]|nr:MAG: hypothetical protein EU550_02510 [Candidatus Lokiarchaeota archaeon]